MKLVDGDGLGRGDDRQRKLTVVLVHGAWAGADDEMSGISPYLGLPVSPHSSLLRDGAGP